MSARFIMAVVKILFGVFIVMLGISVMFPALSDFVSLEKEKVTQWVDPFREKPTSYSEWQEKQTISPLRVTKRYSTSFSKFLTTPSQKFYVLVNSTVYDNIDNSVNQYVLDIENEGYSVVVYSGTFNSPQKSANPFTRWPIRRTGRLCFSGRFSCPLV